MSGNVMVKILTLTLPQTSHACVLTPHECEFTLFFVMVEIGGRHALVTSIVMTLHVNVSFQEFALQLFIPDDSIN
jgi:hypothetical protein